MDNLKVGAEIPANVAPSIAVNNTNLAYAEGNAATQVDSAATVSDSDGDADWNGGSLSAQITGNAEAGDRISIIDSDGDGTAITVSGTNIFANAVDIGDLSASGGVVTNGTKLTITFDSDATNANVQEVLQSIRYESTTQDPGTSNRTVNFTATDSSAASSADTRVIAMTAVNDEPTLTANGSNPTFTEGAAAASLFSGSSVSTVESGQTISGLAFTTTNVNDGSNERLNVDGSAVVLTHGTSGTSGTTASNSLSYSVSVVGTTATVSLSGGTLSTAATQTLVDCVSYQNNSNAPNTSNRVVTLTTIQDSGGTANGGDNTAALAIASTVTVVQNNDEPTLTANGSNPTFTEGGAAASLFSGSSISTVESGQTIKGLTLTATNITNGSNEVANVDGTAITLTNGASGTTATNSLSYSVSVAGTTATISLTGGTLSTAATQTLVDSVSYQNNSNAPSTSNRVVTITSLQDSGGTANGGDDTASLAIASTVTVVGVNDEPTLTANGSNPTFTEGGAAASLFSGSSVSTVESGQTISGLTFTTTNVNDGSNERLNVDGSAVVLTHGTSGTTASNSLSYSVSVIGTTATVSLTGGTLSTAATQTLVDGMSYQNNSNAPNTSNRVVTLTSIQDSGGTANGGDNTAALAIASTVTVVQNNDEPTLTANGSNPTFTEGGAAASLFSGSSISTVESGQTIKGLTFTATNVTNGSNEIANVDGTAITLTHGTSGTTATNSLSYSVSVVGTTATISLTGGTVSTAATQTLVDGMSYQNNSNAPSTSNRVVTITSLQDNGGTANSGDDTASLTIASTVTVVSVNSAPVAVNNSAVTQLNTPITLTVTTNDSDADGTIDVATVDLDPATPGQQTTVAVPGKGSFSVDGAGNVTFTPEVAFTGNSAVTYKVADDVGELSGSATISIDVNTPPVATGDNAVTQINTPVTYSATGNDSDSDGTIDGAAVDLDPVTAGQQTTYTVVSQGTFTVDGLGNVTFTPVAAYTGTTTATYKVSDNDGASRLRPTCPSESTRFRSQLLTA